MKRNALTKVPTHKLTQEKHRGKFPQVVAALPALSRGVKGENQRDNRRVKKGREEKRTVNYTHT